MAIVYRPIFAGDTEAGERIVIYRRGPEFHIKVDDSELWALGPQYSIQTYNDELAGVLEVTIESPQWTGTFKGSRALALGVEAIRLVPE